MGWDSFGLPAENAAIDRGVNPKDWTVQNISEMKTQLDQLGFDFDWDREVSTCSPDYYKHTQQIFKEMKKAGLAYKDDSSYVNWDPVDMTVLANEQIDANGCSWRSGAKVEKKHMSQWYLDIVNYAPEMLKELEGLDQWPQAVKESQRSWIGEQKGFNLQTRLSNSQNGESLKLDAFVDKSEVKLLNHARFLALNYEALSTDDKALLFDDDLHQQFEQYFKEVNELQLKGQNLKDSKQLEPGLKLD